MKNLKKVLALVLAVVMIMGTVAVASAKDYKDVKSYDEYAAAIDILSSLNILDGFEDGEFKADETLNRAQAAKIVALVHNAATTGTIKGAEKIADLYANAQNPFVDCNDSWALPYINYCRITGLADGMTATTYEPTRKLTGVQWLKLMLTTLGFDTAKEGYTGTGWDVNVLNRANEIGLLNGLADGWKGIDNIKRGEAAQILVNALQKYLVEYGQLIKSYGDTTKGTQDKPIKASFVSNEQVNKTGTTLGGKMNVTIVRMYDVFGRPGMKWAYGAWSKFYMDAPLASYTTAVSDCDLLVAAGYDRNSKETMTYDEFVNGQLTTNKKLTHVGKACYGTAHGDTGALVQLFKVDGNYIVTRIDTYLTKVTAVATNAAHGNNGGSSTFTVYPAYASKFDNNTSTYTISGLYSYARNSYVLAYVSLDVAKAGTAYAGKIYTADTVVATSATETASSGVYGITEYTNTAFVPVKVAESKAQKLTGRALNGASAAGTTTSYVTGAQLTVDGTQTPTAAKYGLDEANVDGTPFDAINGTYTFFRDQYDNLIGDTKIGTEYSYGVVTGIVWITNGASYSDAQYASAGFVKAGAEEVTDVKVVKAGINGAAVKDLAGTESAVEGSIVAGTVSTVKTLNNYYTNNFTGNKLAVVKYSESDGSYTLHYNDSTVFDMTTATEISATKPMIETGFIADENTVFTVRTGANTYKSFTGIKNVPTIKNADIVAVRETESSFVSFVYVDARNAIFAGSSTVAYVYAPAVTYEENGTYYTYHNIFINGEKTSINVPKSINGVEQNYLFTTVSGLYKLGYNADATQVISVENINSTMVSDVIASVSGYVVRAKSDQAKSFNAENAKIYFLVELGSSIVDVEVKTVEDLAGAVGCTFEYTYSTNAWNADVVYVHVPLD